MAHFALIDENNIVQEVHVLNNDIITDKDGNEQEYLGVNFLTNLHKSTGTWKQTSYNTREGKYYNVEDGSEHEDQSKAFRGNYAQIGGTWNPELNVFLDVKPYDSWVLHNELPRWQSPIGDPPPLTDEQESETNSKTHWWHYYWDEANLRWVLKDHLE
jgi:hypothetical protein|tara:strand:- start:2385 stop:2858 length:474 start_codon:yes stop_codon:yes gene_type:complete